MLYAHKYGSAGTSEKTMLFKYSFCCSLIGVAVGFCLLLINGREIYLDLYTVLTAALFGAMLALCTLITFYSMQVTTVAISSVFKAASVIIPCVFGAIFFDESITLLNIVGFLLFILSVYLIVYPPKIEATKRFGFSALLACIAVLLTNGFGSVAIQLFGKLVPYGNEAVFMFISYAVQSLILGIVSLLFALKHKNEAKNRVSKKMWIFAFVGTACGFAINQTLTALSSHIPALVIFPITMGSSVIMGVIVGWVCFKEKLTLKNMIGIFFGILSLVMINLF